MKSAKTDVKVSRYWKPKLHVHGWHGFSGREESTHGIRLLPNIHGQAVLVGPLLILPKKRDTKPIL